MSGSGPGRSPRRRSSSDPLRAERFVCSPASRVQILQRHEQWFPKTGRLAVADQQASNSVFRDGMSEETRLRNATAAVDGDCPCRGTRRIRAVYEEGNDQPAMLCPVHAQATIRAHRVGFQL